MVLEILFVAVLPAIFITAAAWDLTSFTIPNAFPSALIALFVVFAAYALLTQPDVSIGDIGWNAAAGGMGLVTGLLLFALGWIGGGDAKLFAVACLWLGWDMLFQYVVLASLLGGVLTIGLLILRKVPLPSVLHSHGWLVKLTDKNSGIPYGVALSAAAISLLPSSEFFRVAAAS